MTENDFLYFDFYKTFLFPFFEILPKWPFGCKKIPVSLSTYALSCSVYLADIKVFHWTKQFSLLQENLNGRHFEFEFEFCTQVSRTFKLRKIEKDDPALYQQFSGDIQKLDSEMV